MRKIIYTQDNGVLAVVIPAPKSKIEEALGIELSNQEYRDHVLKVSLPSEDTPFREIDDSDMPADREFRNAWVDMTPDSKVNIDVSKAKALKLAKLRTERDRQLDKLDKEYLIALDRGGDLASIRSRKQALRDATEPLKALDVAGLVDDDEKLELIKQLSVLQEV